MATELEKKTIAETLRWLRDNTVYDTFDRGVDANADAYVYNQFDLVLDALKEKGIE